MPDVVVSKLYADPVSGEWTWSNDGAWCGGFWPGLLWLSALATGRAAYAEAAADGVSRLAPRTTSPTVLRGFLFWYGAGVGSMLARADREVARAAVDAARSLAEDFDDVAQLLPPGADDATLYDWPRPGAPTGAHRCADR